MTKQEILSSLNTEQKRAVSTVDGCVRLIAGAGSGKTSTLTKRIAYICEDKGVDPSRILCLTFTNKAAAEMKERAASLMGVEEDSLNMMTFHRLALNIIEEDASIMGWEKATVGEVCTPFLVQDFMKSHEDLLRNVSEEDKEFISESLVRYCTKVVEGSEYPAVVLDKNAPLLPPVSAEELIAYEREKQRKLEITKDAKSKLAYRQKKVKDGKAKQEDFDIIAELEKTIEENKHEHQENSPTSTWANWVVREKIKYGYMNFNELIAVAKYMLDTYEEVREKWQDTFDYIQIDEFQDTDMGQLGIALALAEKHGNLFVVGDGDQSIYSFRGTTSKIFNHLNEHIPNLQTILMTRNYRCSKQVLDVANSVIRLDNSRIEKDLVSVRGTGDDEVELVRGNGDEEAGRMVATMIKERISAGVNPKSIAVLYRASNDELAKQVMESLAKLDIPMVTELSSNPIVAKYEKMAMDIFKYKHTGNDLFLNAFVNEVNEKSITTYKEMKRIVDNTSSVVETIQKFVPETVSAKGLPTGEWKKWRDNYGEIAPALTNVAGTWNCMSEEEKDAACSEDALLSTDDTLVGEGVRLMTIHKSKGLEYEHVFVLDISDKLKNTVTNPENKEIKNEETRIQYVAYSRAKDELVIATGSPSEKDSIFVKNIAPLCVEMSPMVNESDFESDGLEDIDIG